MNLDCFSGAKVLVTGHTGFKGSWLCLWLQNLGADVYGVSDQIYEYPCNFSALGLENTVKSSFFDICDTTKVHELLQSVHFDFIFHLAAQALVGSAFDDPVATFTVNSIGTISILESLRKISYNCVCIFITSDKCYENVEWCWGYRETDQLGGSDPYSASKAAAEIAISSYFRSFLQPCNNLRIGVCRAGNVIGGGDWAVDRIVPDCARSWSTGSSVKLRNPHSTRPWQHVLEPLSGYLTLASNLFNSSDLNGEAFNFGPSEASSFSVVDVVSRLASYWPDMQYSCESGSKHTSLKECNLLRLNCDKAKFYLDWTSTWDFETTIKYTALWYKQFYDQRAPDMKSFSLEQLSIFSEGN